MAEELFAGMGEIVIGKSPDILVSLGLGSCIGCILYEPELKIGGLAHVMLPTSSLSRAGSDNMNKFADVAIPEMVKQLKAKGVKIENCICKMAGGSQMFFGGVDSQSSLDIGTKNKKAVIEEIEKLGLKPSVIETGGNNGRTVRFETETGVLHIKSKDQVKDV
jgi:chemotaxis protein CheD